MLTSKEIELTRIAMDAVAVINQIALEQQNKDPVNAVRIAQAGNTIAHRINKVIG